jgi:tetratricopeptide repeat protein
VLARPRSLSSLMRLAALLPIRERVLGTEHPETLGARRELVGWTGAAGDAAGARDQYAVLLPVIERVLGPEHPHTLADRGNLARWMGEAGPATSSPRCCPLSSGCLAPSTRPHWRPAPTSPPGAGRWTVAQRLTWISAIGILVQPSLRAPGGVFCAVGQCRKGSSGHLDGGSGGRGVPSLGSRTEVERRAGVDRTESS